MAFLCIAAFLVSIAVVFIFFCNSHLMHILFKIFPLMLPLILLIGDRQGIHPSCLHKSLCHLFLQSLIQKSRGGKLWGVQLS